jgi:Icc-related predicted phosphoesterase
VRGDVEVFAVESRAVQLSWSHLPAREVTLEVGDRSVDVECAPPPWHRRWGRPLPAGLGGPGALTFEGLEAGTVYEATLRGPSLPRRRAAVIRTLDEGPGRLLWKFATVGDCHIGQYRLGLRGRLRDPRPLPEGLLPYPERSLIAAIGEAEAWGARTLVAKGDLTEEATFKEARRLVEILGEAEIPVHAVLGNHDVRGKCDVAAALSEAGFDASASPRAVDLPGIRIVLGHSPVKGSHAGRLDTAHLDALERLTADTDSPVAVILHHPPSPLPVQTVYPPGIEWRDSVELTRRLRRANPSVLVLSGHTHRNRRYQVRGIDVTEVGSTKDYPGQWAGYSVYEGGIRQVVRRVSRPDVVAWTDMTGRVLAGVWGRWSPGRMADRCWTIDWDPVPAGTGPSPAGDARIPTRA